MYRRFLFLGLFASVFTIFPFRINNSSAAEPSFPIKATIQVGDSPQGIAVNPNTNRIYVTNYSSNSVSVIDGDTNTVIDTIAVGNAPQGIAVNPVTNKIYVANGNSGDPVYVIDGNNNAVIKTIPVAINARGVAVNPNTNSIYVTTNPGNIYFPNLEVIDGTSDTVIKDVIPVHYYAPSGIGAAVNTLNNRVFVETGNGTVSVLDGNTNEYFDNVVQNIGNGTLNGIDINPNTNLVYVAHTTANSSIFVIDGVTNAKLTPIPFMQNQSPQAIRVNPSTNHAFITTSQGFLWVLDLNTNQFFDPISITSGLRGIGINPLTNHVYVASLNDGTVRVFGDEPTPTPLPDLTVVSVRPIQVVENVQINSDDRIDLVLDKRMVVRVQIEIDNDQTLLPSQAITTQIRFQGTIKNETRSIQQLIDNNHFIDIMLTPYEPGDSTIFVYVNSDDSIAESNKDNNEGRAEVTVKDTRKLYLFNIEVIDGDSGGPMDFTNTVDEGGRLVNWVFPVAENEFKNERSPVPFRSFFTDRNLLSRKDNYRALVRDGEKIWNLARKQGYDRAVAIVTQSYLDRRSPCNTGAIGAHSDEINQTVFVVEGNYSVTAHELAHTYGIGEGYTWKGGEDPCRAEGIIDTTALVDGYNVDLQKPVLQARDYMGIPQNPKILDEWTTKATFENLFKEFLINPGDPELLLMAGEIDLDGSVELGILDRTFEGIPDEITQSEYSLEILDITGNSIETFPLPVDYVLHQSPLPPMETEIGVFMAAVPYPREAISLEIRHNDESLLELDLNSGILHKAIDAIPTIGFIRNPEQYRNALHEKVNEVEIKIKEGDIEGAVNKLRYDIRENLDRWLVNDYKTESALQYSKLDILALVDEIIERLSMLNH